MGAESASEQQSHRLIEPEHLDRRSSDGSSDFDVEDDPLYTPPPTKSPVRRRRRKNTISRFGTLKCSTINRKTRLLLLVISFVVLLFTSLAVYRKRHNAWLKKKLEHEAQEAEAAKPSFCSSWPRREGKRDAQPLSSARVQNTQRSDLSSRAKWKKPSGFKIIATVFCTCWKRLLSERSRILTLCPQMVVDETSTCSIAICRRT